MRFIVEVNEYKAYKIIDTQAKKWNMPEKAVSIYFNSKDTAEIIATFLNNEWLNFLRNPN